MGSSALVAQAAVDHGLGGWWLGTVIGVAVVVIVAAVAVTLIWLATRITKQAGMAAQAIDAAEANTRALWRVGAVNDKAVAILQGTVLAREALEGRR